MSLISPKKLGSVPNLPKHSLDTDCAYLGFIMTKIALLGDIHFGRLARSSEFAVPGEMIKDATSGGKSLVSSLVKVLKEENIEYIFIAGDLTSTGSPVEYVKCYEVISNIALSSDIDPKNIIISFGNHDVDWRISSIIEDKNAPYNDLDIVNIAKCYYQKISASVGGMCIRANEFTEIGPVPFSGVCDKENIVIFVLNSGWNSSKDNKIPHGKLSVEQLNWLKMTAKKHQHSKKWKILLLHHHPHNYPYPLPGHDYSLLEEGSELLEIAGKNGFHLVCHGHRHHPRVFNSQESRWTNAITFICTGSFSVNAEHRDGGSIPNCFHILELIDTGEKIIKLKNYTYSDSEGWVYMSGFKPETPLDPEMFFHKPYTMEEREKALSKVVETAKNNEVGFVLPGWESLPLQLRTMYYNDLNAMLKKDFGHFYTVAGGYPSDVAFIRRS